MKFLIGRSHRSRRPLKKNSSSFFPLEIQKHRDIRRRVRGVEPPFRWRPRRARGAEARWREQKGKKKNFGVCPSNSFKACSSSSSSSSQPQPKKTKITQPVAAISFVGAARKVAVLIDGNVSLLDEETLDAVPMPAGEGWRSVGGGVGGGLGGGSGSREAAPSLPLLSLPSPSSGGITAIAAAPPCSSAGAAAASDDAAFSASCLAVAGRARGRLLGGIGGGGGTSRAAVFFVVPAGRGERGGAGTPSSSASTSKSSSPSPPPAVCVHSVEWGEPLAVTTVAWAGSGALVLGSALRYSLWRLQPPLSRAAAAASAAVASGGGAPTSPPSAVVPLLELSADAPAATPVALRLPSLSVSSPPQQQRKKDRGGYSKEEEEERATAAATAATTIPSAVLLLVERAGVAVGADGMPARGRPGAATFAEAPTALATVRVFFFFFVFRRGPKEGRGKKLTFFLVSKKKTLSPQKNAGRRGPRRRRGVPRGRPHPRRGHRGRGGRRRWPPALARRGRARARAEAPRRLPPCYQFLLF